MARTRPQCHYHWAAQALALPPCPSKGRLTSLSLPSTSMRQRSIQRNHPIQTVTRPYHMMIRSRLCKLQALLSRPQLEIIRGLRSGRRVLRRISRTSRTRILRAPQRVQHPHIRDLRYLHYLLRPSHQTGSILYLQIKNLPARYSTSLLAFHSRRPGARILSSTTALSSEPR